MAPDAKQPLLSFQMAFAGMHWLCEPRSAGIHTATDTLKYSTSRRQALLTRRCGELLEAQHHSDQTGGTALTSAGEVEVQLVPSGSKEQCCLC